MQFSNLPDGAMAGNLVGTLIPTGAFFFGDTELGRSNSPSALVHPTLDSRWAPGDLTTETHALASLWMVVCKLSLLCFGVLFVHIYADIYQLLLDAPAKQAGRTRAFTTVVCSRT